MVADGENVYFTWWETDNRNVTEPVLKVSNDNGETFGETIMLATNGTICGYVLLDYYLLFCFLSINIMNLSLNLHLDYNDFVKI